jgi:hypothetical protein
MKPLDSNCDHVFSIPDVTGIVECLFCRVEKIIHECHSAKNPFEIVFVPRVISTAILMLALCVHAQNIMPQILPAVVTPKLALVLTFPMDTVNPSNSFSVELDDMSGTNQPMFFTAPNNTNAAGHLTTTNLPYADGVSIAGFELIVSNLPPDQFMTVMSNPDFAIATNYFPPLQIGQIVQTFYGGLMIAKACNPTGQQFWRVNPKSVRTPACIGSPIEDMQTSTNLHDWIYCGTFLAGGKLSVQTQPIFSTP